ncbi:MAG TPA: response regulator transcription factor, partial [Rhodopila sp.]|nr:response regulator transcription factor [Rhodopila sp.]
MRLLIVEDDDRAGSYLARGLTESGHIVDRATDGELGFALASEGIYDALVIDRRLPAMDGLTLIRRLRRQGTVTPILVLSAVGGTADRVEGMRAGCDDYLAKPYAFAEVLARLEAVARRADRALGASVLVVGELELDMAARRAMRGGKEIRLQ